jgi:hypothetical protein
LLATWLGDPAAAPTARDGATAGAAALLTVAVGATAALLDAWAGATAGAGALLAAELVDDEGAGEAAVATGCLVMPTLLTGTVLLLGCAPAHAYNKVGCDVM